MGLSSKAASASNICLKERNEKVFHDTKNCSIFKNFFPNLAQNLVSKLPPSPNVFTETLSKIIERIIHDQTQEFLSKNKILYRFQSGFRKNYSTNTCLGHLTDKITIGFEKGLFTGMILIDLKKAFDTIDHQILIKKMKYLRFLKKCNCLV